MTETSLAVTAAASVADSEFRTRFFGGFRGILRWVQLDSLWRAVLADDTGWYIYFLAETPPTESVEPARLQRFVAEIDRLLRTEHDYDYCGVVYVDNREHPEMIKIFDPGDLGSVCGPSEDVVLPRWVMSRIRPEPLGSGEPAPKSGRRWWQRLFR